jgi:hypothetical protein
MKQDPISLTQVGDETGFRVSNYRPRTGFDFSRDSSFGSFLQQSFVKHTSQEFSFMVTDRQRLKRCYRAWM